MKHLFTLLILAVLLTACGQQQTPAQASDSGIPGLTRAAVMDRIEREMTTSDYWNSHRHRTEMTSYRDGLEFDVTLLGAKLEGVTEQFARMRGDSTGRPDFDSLVAYHAGIDSLKEIAPIDTVLAELHAAPGAGDLNAGLPMLAALAGIPYDGADPDRARRWLREMWGQADARVVIGPVEFILRAPTEHERVLLMRHLP